MGKNTQNNKDMNITFEIKRMELFLTWNIYVFTFGTGVVNEKLIFT